MLIYSPKMCLIGEKVNKFMCNDIMARNCKTIHKLCITVVSEHQLSNIIYLR